jgi:hypothetical protein
MVSNASTGNLKQLAANVVSLGLKKGMPPGALNLILGRHYDALAQGRPLPVPPSAAVKVVELIRELWPAPVEPRRVQPALATAAV